MAALLSIVALGLAGTGYVLIYRVTPSRHAMRSQAPGRLRKLVLTGSALVVLSCAVSAQSWGPTGGIVIGLSVATAVGCALVVAGPLSGWVAAGRGDE